MDRVTKAARSTLHGATGAPHCDQLRHHRRKPDRARGPVTRPSQSQDIIRLRLRNQRLTRTGCQTAADVVSWLGAVQAQDYPGAAWAIGLRASGITAGDVGRAFDDGRLLRTHVMRATWHFVAPADIRWLLALTGPRVSRVCSHYCRKAGLDEKIFTRSRRTIERALRDGRQLTRPEIGAALRRVGIDVRGTDLAFVVMRLELDAVVCNGARRGKQFTYALMDERVPATRTLTRDEALVELTMRYVTSHGPATIRDYVWWSGLTVREARAGIDMVRSAVEKVTIDDLTYWFVPSKGTAPLRAPTVHFLPNYDEYLIAYKDRGTVRDETSPTLPLRQAFSHLLVIDGRIRGTWKRTLGTRTTGIEVRLLRPLNRAETRAAAAEAERFGAFVNAPVALSFV
jgi:DNA glycosylase AlkZ-like